jgi:hypothetical protein
MRPTGRTRAEQQENQRDAAAEWLKSDGEQAKGS